MNKLVLPPEQELRYMRNLRRASDDDIGIARMLQAAAFQGKIPQMPAPVYIEQAMWLKEHGYKITMEKKHD